MTLIKSISGIRGTIGGCCKNNLTPEDIVKFTTAFACLVKKEASFENKTTVVNKDITCDASRPMIVVGRDARLSGSMVNSIVCGTLMGMGFNVKDIGLASTPTVELATALSDAKGGVIITASHNSRQWNALKLLNNKGEFIDAKQGNCIIEMVEREDFSYATIDKLGTYSIDNSWIKRHVDAVLALPLVQKDIVRQAKFHVCVDAINSVGATILPLLLEELGVEFTLINGQQTGDFAHNPEPLERNLGQIMTEMSRGHYDLGIVVDPDVDRLAFVNENGSMFSEENTLVATSDYVLSHKPGNTVSNLSSTRALRDITLKYGGKYVASAVGEVNVTAKMKEVNAVIGGEGNGGVIYPLCHYGRDAIVGTALFLSYMAEKGLSPSCIKAQLPQYFMVKDKLELPSQANIDAIFVRLKDVYRGEEINEEDGVKIDFVDRWVHLRKSNTEPIIRIYGEATTQLLAEELVGEIKELAKRLI